MGLTTDVAGRVPLALGGLHSLTTLELLQQQQSGGGGGGGGGRLQHTVYELPPNGQGLVVLEALGLLEQYPLADLPATERAHVVIEALKIAFADAVAYVADPDAVPFPPEALLDLDFLEQRVEAIGTRADPTPGPALPSSDTVYVAAVDAEGNACSLIHSVYMHFGACVVADGTGICLQNRGHLFSTDPAHPNALAPRKRPYHTIIPAMVFRSGRPWLVFGVVGGTQQPQAQVQLLSQLIDLGRPLREAVAAPRFRWIEGDRVRFEEGFDGEVRAGLVARGHVATDDARHGGFGGAQAILIEDETLARVGASDPRKDGRVGRVGGPKKGLPVSGA